MILSALKIIGFVSLGFILGFVVAGLLAAGRR